MHDGSPSVCWPHSMLIASSSEPLYPMVLLPSLHLGSPRPLLGWGVAAAVALLIAATVGLWVHYGTAVFYEIVAAGMAWCL